MPRVFLVTGCSTGFGKYLIEHILEAGDIAVATARNPFVVYSYRQYPSSDSTQSLPLFPEYHS